MNTSNSEQGRELPSDLKSFKCPYCSEYQPFFCPGFGQHSPSQTLIRSGDHAQCTQCQAHVAHMTCEMCGHVTVLTADILDDPIGSRYWQDDHQRVYQLNSELHKRYLQVLSIIVDHRIDETTITELQTILAERERLLDSLPEEYPPLNPYSVRGDIAATQQRIADAYVSLHKSQEALLYYNLARQTYHALGEKANAEWCWECSARIELQEEGIIDNELQRRQAQLEVLPRGTEPYISAMLELGQLYRDAGETWPNEF